MKNRIVIPVVILTVVLFILLFCYFYMVDIQGEWSGVPFENEMKYELGEIESQIESDIRYMSEELGPRNQENFKELCECAEWIKERWRLQRYSVRSHKYSVEGREHENLEIEIKGNTAPDEIVIVSAQYDTLPGSPGANNNGSGVAVLLQLSKLLKDFTPDRTLRLIVFDTEEPPFFDTENMGSFQYARDSYEKRENICVMLSLDAIGYYSELPDSQKLPFPFSMFYPDRGDFLAFIANLDSRRYVTRATEGFKRGSSFPVEAGIAPEWVSPAGWSDHLSFWRFGYPGIMVTDTGGFRSPWHSNEGDTMEKLNCRAMARIACGMYMSIVEITRKENLADRIFASPGKHLIIVGVIVLIFGMLSGFPFRNAILKKTSGEKLNAWRVTHAFLIMDGIMMLVVGLFIPYIMLAEFTIWVMAWSLILSGIGFVIAFVIGSWRGFRGLTLQPAGLNRMLYFTHVVGALGSLLGILIFLYGILIS